MPKTGAGTLLSDRSLGYVAFWAGTLCWSGVLLGASGLAMAAPSQTIAPQPAPLLATVAQVTSAPPPRVAPVSIVPAAPISLQTLRDVTRELSSDRLAGRAPVSPEEAPTIDYIAQEMHRAGLKPGYRGGWFQSVPMVEVDTTPGPMTFTGGSAPVSLNWKTDMVANTYRVASDIAITDSNVVFVGYGVNAPEVGWNDYAGVDVRGKTVVILINDPDWQTPGLTGPFNGRAMTYYGRWTYKFEEAARQGAAAAILVHDTVPAAYPWDVVVSSWAKPTLELDDANNHMDQSQAIGWVTLDAARRVFASAGMDIDALRQRAGERGFHAVTTPLKFSLSATNSIRRHVSNNVIGIQPGRTRPDEYVLYTAHWDHLGRCQPVNGDSICNGAVDNATGVAGLIALAQANVAAGAPDRTQVFVAVTAEESGLLGSRYYAEHPLFPLGRTVGGVNMDGLNVFGPTRDFVIIGQGKSTLDAYVTTAVTAQGRRISPEPNPERGSYYRSDHFSLAHGGVPMLDGRGGIDLVDGGVAAGQQASDAYTNSRYHKPQDEYNPAWNWAGAVQDLQIFYQVGRSLAQNYDWPQWSRDSEFYAVRARSRASDK